MFDVSWQEILVIGIVALIVVGPKELPGLLRTVGKYMGLIKRQAAEFRAQFDEAMRESELDQLKKDVEKIKDDAESSIRDVHTSVESEFGSVKRDLDDATQSIAGSGTKHPDAHDANGLPFPSESSDRTSLPAPPPATGAAAVAAAAAAAPPAGPSKVDA